MVKPVVNINDLPLAKFGPKDSPQFGAEIGELGEALGSRDLGAMYLEVAPGKRAFPFHNHLGQDEMFIVLAGNGTYRYGDSEYAITVGSVCYAPKGGRDTAHQIINTGDSVLKYIGISTMTDPEVVEYPDSQKFSVLGIAPGDSYAKRYFGHIGRRQDRYDYWDGEE